MEFNGILNLYKPIGYTSFEMVREVKKIFNTKKVGHAGTLDPNASGVIPICIGKATKLVDYIHLMKKEYVGEITFGTKTDTLDIWGKVLESGKEDFKKEDLLLSLDKIRSKDIKQVPPMYSALKYNGKKLYELARDGIEVERKERISTIYDIKLLEAFNNKANIICLVSKGTYIRVLFEDIAKDMGMLAHMSRLCRTKYGKFSIENSINLKVLKSIPDDLKDKYLMKIEDFFDYDRVDFDKVHFKHISNALRKKFKIEKSGTFKIYCDDKFIGIGELEGEGLEKVLVMKNIFL